MIITLAKTKIEHNPNWPHTPDKPLRILLIGGSGITNVLLNLIENQPDIEKIYLHAKDSCGSKHQYLIKIHEKVGIEYHNDPRAYIIY